MIEVSHISIKYDQVILDDESIKIPVGKMTLLNGKSGVGKTALLYRIALISDDQSYDYKCNHQSINTKKEREQFRKNNISYVLQDIDFFPHFNVYQTIQYYAQFIQKELSIDEMKQMLSLVKLDIDLNQNIMTLSLGEKQRMSIICALIKSPSFLILDEPTASLDEDNEKIIFEILKNLTKKGLTILVASHSTLAQDYADIIYTIKDTHIHLVRGDIKDYPLQINQPFKIKDRFLKNYAQHYIKYYRFIYSFLIMILTISMLSANVFNIFITHFQTDSIEVLKGQFDNKIVITKDPDSIFLDQQFTTYMSACDIEHSYPLYQMKVLLDDEEIDVIPYFPVDNLDRHLISQFSAEEDGVYVDSLTYYHYQQANLTSVDIYVKDQNLEYLKNQDIKINGVLQESYQQHYTSHSQRFIFMNYNMMKDIYESLPVSHQYAGYVILYDHFNQLQEGETELKALGYHLNTSFTDTYALNQIINYYTFLQMVIIGLIMVVTLIIDIILMSHIHMQKRKENMLLRVTGLSYHHLLKIGIYEYIIEMIVTILLSSIVTIIISLIAAKISLHTFVIMIIFDIMYFILILIERMILMNKELHKYTIETILRESEVE